MTEPVAEMPTTTTTTTNHSDRRQLIAAIILGVAAVLTALSSYSSSLAGGNASNLRTDAGRTLADANFFYSQANQVQTGDQVLFVAFATATEEENGTLQEYLKGAMRPVMKDAIDWWLKTADAETPFDDLEGNPYVLEDLADANALEKKASRQVVRSQHADHKASRFDLATVLLALTLFFGGVATLFRRRIVTWLLLAVSVATLGAGSALLLANFPA